MRIKQNKLCKRNGTSNLRVCLRVGFAPLLYIITSVPIILAGNHEFKLFSHRNLHKKLYPNVKFALGGHRLPPEITLTTVLKSIMQNCSISKTRYFLKPGFHSKSISQLI